MTEQKPGGHFMHPDFVPLIDQVPQNKTSDPRKNIGPLRKFINEAAQQHATHPLVVAKELQLARVDNQLEASTIERARTSRYGYVSDLHGLTDADFAKLRDTLVAGEFTQVFVLGDIGGSEKLTRLQRLYYQGGPTLEDNQFANKYKSMMTQPNANQDQAIDAVRPGYQNLRAYEIFLEANGKLTEEQAAQKAQEEIGALKPEEVKARILKALTHDHYGHYVSDLPDSAIISLQADVEHYYERFLTMAQEIRSRGVEVFVIQGNWDARLPFDFEPNKPTAVPLPQEKRRFNPKEFFRKRVPYYTTLGTVDSRDAIHIMVPFDTVADDINKTIKPERLNEIKQRVEAARKAGKRVVMLAHAVPAWEKHSDKEPNKEGKTTQEGLQRLAVILGPDDLIYGHEHKARANAQAIYKMRPAGDKVEIGPDQELKDLDKTPPGTQTVHLPIPEQLKVGVGSLEQARYGKGAPRGNGGKQSPIRVDRPVVRHINLASELPTVDKNLYPQGRRPKQEVKK
jgi:Icc-related predicted phosphoesterase